MTGITLVGALGGWTGALLQGPVYMATAYAVVYRMPPGLTDLISPDEANNLQSVYEAGAFQDAVIAKSLPYFPGLTREEWRSRVRIAIVAYSPYTRVTVTSPDPRQAVALANNVSDTWATLTQRLYDDTFTSLRARFTGRMDQVDKQVAALQSAVVTQQAMRPRNPALVQATQAELTAAQEQQQQLAAILDSLTTYHNQGQSLAYTAIRADARSLAVRSDTLRSTGSGTVIGFISGVLLALWSLRRSVWTRRESTAVDVQVVGSPAEGWR
jgi:hypothetical protein